MRKIILVSLLILIFFVCLGLVGGTLFFLAENQGFLSRWEGLGVTPEKSVEIVTGDINTVYVRTDSGSIYGCRHEEKDVSQSCWFKASPPLDVDPETVFDSPLYDGAPEPPNNLILDDLDATIWYADAAFETRYALDADSMVWKWEYDRNWLDIFTCFLGPLVGAAVGLLLAIGLWFFVWISRLLRRREV